MQNPRAKPIFTLQWPGMVKWILFLILLLNHATTALSSSSHLDFVPVRYSELRTLNASCFPKDTCRDRRQEDDILIRSNCLCNETCATYDACCVDSPYRNFFPNGKSTSNCVNVEHTGGDYGYVFMVDKCSSDYEGDYIKERCSGDATSLNDPMLLMPVTNSMTGITYKNYFCAVCHDDVMLAHSVFWPIRLLSSMKQITPAEIPNLRYDTELYSWVLPDSEDNSTNLITIHVEIPESIDNIKRCVSHVTSACVDGWMDDEISDKCAAYTALVALYDEEKGDLIRFRNIHCAICNGFSDYNRVNCEFPLDGSGDGAYVPWSMSFAHLLDVNRSDGDRVGIVERCSENAVYDPIFSKCRTVRCALRGYVIKNGSCQRQ